MTFRFVAWVYARNFLQLLPRDAMLARYYWGTLWCRFWARCGYW